MRQLIESKVDRVNYASRGAVFVVAGLLGIGSAMATSRGKQAPFQKPNASQSATFERAKNIGLAAVLFVSKHKNTYPAGKTTAEFFRQLTPFMKSKTTFESQNPKSKKFLFNLSLSGVPISSLTNPAVTVVAYDEKPWPDQTRIVVKEEDGIAANLISRLTS